VSWAVQRAPGGCTRARSHHVTHARTRRYTPPHPPGPSRGPGGGAKDTAAVEETLCPGSLYANNIVAGDASLRNLQAR